MQKPSIAAPESSTKVVFFPHPAFRGSSGRACRLSSFFLLNTSEDDYADVFLSSTGRGSYSLSARVTTPGSVSRFLTFFTRTRKTKSLSLGEIDFIKKKKEVKWIVYEKSHSQFCGFVGVETPPPPHLFLPLLFRSQGLLPTFLLAFLISLLLFSFPLSARLISSLARPLSPGTSAGSPFTASAGPSTF